MLYKKYVKMHLKSTMQYKFNVMLLGLSSTLISLSEIISVWLLFLNFKSVGYWGFYETALMFGIVTFSFAFVETFARGFDEFSTLIKDGMLDRLLVRPVNIYKQIFGSKIEFSRLGRVILGLIVSIIAICNLNIQWTIFKVLVLIGAFVCACCIIFGLILINAGVTVFSVENLEFLNILTYGSKELSFYPINIYNKWLARIFTFIIPIACFNYLPISYIMGYGSSAPIIYALSPFIGMLFIIPCILFFNWCLKKYQGTGT